jgi:hypothetical protein
VVQMGLRCWVEERDDPYLRARSAARAWTYELNVAWRCAPGCADKVREEERASK